MTHSSVRAPTSALISAVLLLSFVAHDAAAQQSPNDASTGPVIGTGAVTGFVEDMDRSLAFYHDVFGMQIPDLPDSGARPYNPTNAQLFAMFDIDGARERHQFARIPDSDVRFELMEIQDVDHRDIALRIQDPGAMTLVFTVSDLDGLLERIRENAVDVVTPGGAPVALADGARAILVRDVDGRHVELREPAGVPPSPAAGEPAAITAMSIAIAVADMRRTLEIYRDVLGFTLEEEHPLSADPRLRSLTGLDTAEFLRSTVRGPGSALKIEFIEYRGVETRPLDMRIQDRGAARLQIRAADVEALVAAMKNAGLRVVSHGGGPVPIPPNFMGALVADPNNFFLTPFAPCDGCAPRLLRETD